MSVGFSKRLTVAVFGLLAVTSVGLPRAFAQEVHSHTLAAPQQELSISQTVDAAALIKVVREATERFKDVAAAEAEGYGLQFGCVSGPDSGAMGLHYVNFPLVIDGELDATHPEILMYESTPSGRVQLVGADFLVLADAWNAKNPGPPQLNGQLFHLFEAPNRFGLPAFYTLHVWAWKENPTGAFVNWHRNVSCDAFRSPL